MMNTSLVRLSLGYFCLAMLWILLGDTLLGQLVSGDGQAWQMGKSPVRDAHQRPAVRARSPARPSLR